MDFFEDEKKEEEITAQESIDDIEFDDNIDLDAIQKQLEGNLPPQADKETSVEAGAEQVAEEVVEETSQEISEPETAQINSQLIVEPTYVNDSDCKKYIVYVNPENVEFIDHLSIAERKELINDILREQDQKILNERKMQKRKKFIKHFIVATITFIISLPIIFFLVNKSVELTINSYRQSQKNFEQLYREQGKIQQKTIRNSTY